MAYFGGVFFANTGGGGGQNEFHTSRDLMLAGRNQGSVNSGFQTVLRDCLRQRQKHVNINGVHA